MLRLLLASLILILIYPATAQSAMMKRSDVRHKLDRLVLEARPQKNVHDWIANTPAFSRLDREMLLTAPQLPEKMPVIARRFNDRELVVTADNLTADFQNINQGELVLNGSKIFFPNRVDLATAYQILSGHIDGKSSNIWQHLLAPTVAHAEALHPSCLSSKYEFMFRSPSALLESNFGYAGRLFVASLVISTLNVATAVFTNCDQQVADMRKLLEQGKIGIKAIDCGSDATGNDRSIEFWIPEAGEKGEPKTRSFNLDYTTLLAQDSLKEEDEEEGTVKPTHKKDPALYVFGTNELQEVRVRKINEKDNHYYCESFQPGSAQFAKFQDDIEVYRKVFEYLGNYNGCYACYPQLMRDLRTPKAPDYVVKLAKANQPPKSVKKGKRGKAKDDSDDAGVKSAH